MSLRKLLNINPLLAALLLALTFFIGGGLAALYDQAARQWALRDEPRTFTAATAQRLAAFNQERAVPMSLEEFIEYRKRLAARAFITSLYDTTPPSAGGRKWQEVRRRFLHGAVTPNLLAWLETEIEAEDWKAAFWHKATRTIQGWEVDPLEPDAVLFSFTDETRLFDGSDPRPAPPTTASHLRRVVARVRLTPCPDAGEGEGELWRFKRCMVLGYRVSDYAEYEGVEVVMDGREASSADDRRAARGVN